MLRQPRIHALLAEQDPDTRELYQGFLTACGIQVTCCTEGREALARALSCRHDVLVTGTQLAGVDGYDLCHLLRRDAHTYDLPIILVTADDRAVAIERARKVAATAVLVMPCLPEVLFQEIERVVGPRVKQIVAEEGGPERKRPQFMNRLLERRDTRTPPAPPPALLCPECSKPLSYVRSYLGGVSHRHPEQWDDFTCRRGCGTFEFRHRTRLLRSNRVA